MIRYQGFLGRLEIIGLYNINVDSRLLKWLIILELVVFISCVYKGKVCNSFGLKKNRYRNEMLLGYNVKIVVKVVLIFLLFVRVCFGGLLCN